MWLATIPPPHITTSCRGMEFSNMLVPARDSPIWWLRSFAPTIRIPELNNELTICNESMSEWWSALQHCSSLQAKISTLMFVELSNISVNRLYSNNCASVAELQLTDGIVLHALSFGGTLFISASLLYEYIIFSGIWSLNAKSSNILQDTIFRLDVPVHTTWSSQETEECASLIYV